jgi:ribulose-phosphate 3-epimerase
MKKDIFTDLKKLENTMKKNSFEIIPAIIPNSFDEISQKTKQILGLTETVQIDLIDGKFVKNKSWPFNSLLGLDWQNIVNEVSGMPHWNEVDYEVDLMINDIPMFWNDLVRVGPKRVVFHFPAEQEKVTELKNFIQNLDPYYKNEIELGIAYENATNTNDIIDVKDDIKFVQCMGIEHVGFQGEAFDETGETVFDRIKFVRENLPDKIISVDGGVNLDTIESLHDAGVTRFVCGSVIFKDPDPRMAISELKSTINKN